MELQRSRRTKTFLKKKNKVGRLTLVDFKTYYKATVVRKMWNWHEDRHVDYWNRIESPGMNSCAYDQVVSTGNQDHSMWERIIFSTNGAGTTR